jgi:hypothetical protein
LSGIGFFQLFEQELPRFIFRFDLPFLVEKAPSFQILVFTCRPTDYLGSVALVQDGNAAHADYDGGLIRCIDLRKVIRRR